jgi:hypothetical protein
MIKFRGVMVGMKPTEHYLEALANFLMKQAKTMVFVKLLPHKEGEEFGYLSHRINFLS